MVKNGSIKGAVLKVVMINGYPLDIDAIFRAVTKENPAASYESIRSTLYGLVKDGYLEKTADKRYKATQACIDGMVDGPMSQNTINFAVTKKQ